MPVGNWTTVSIRTSVKDRLQRVYESRKKSESHSFNAYLENLLVEVIEFDEKLQRYGPFIEYKQAVDDHILLFDSFLHKPIVVSINNETKRLFCEHDNSKERVHVGFCFAVKEVYDILIERGFRPPKGSELL